MTVAYSYIRFSSAAQSQGNSLKRQTEASEKYAKEHGLTLDTSLNMHDLGLSAYDRSNIDRGALGRFMDAITQGRVEAGSYLLVESLDRLSRAKVTLALEVFLSILRHGITIVTIVDQMVYNLDTVDGNTGSLMLSIVIMGRAHDESETKSKRIKDAWNNKRKNISAKKLTAQCPRWLKLNSDKTEFHLIPEKVEVIMEILELVKGGMGQAQIAKRLNERNEPPFSNHGKGWHASYIQKILHSIALYGEFQPQLWNGGKLTPHGDPIPEYFPALISKEEFHLLQSIRSERLFDGSRAKKGTTIPNLFSGIAKCGYCGSSMILAGSSAQRVRSDDGLEVKRPSKKVLVCDGGRRGLNCYAVQWGYKDFEKSVLTFCRTLELKKILTSFDSNEKNQKRQLTLAEQLLSLDSEIEDCTTRLNRLVAAIEHGDVPSAVMNRIAALEEQLNTSIINRKNLELEIDIVRSKSRRHLNEVESIRGLIEQMESLTSDNLFMVRSALAQHIRHVIGVVEIYPAGRLDTKESIALIRDGLVDDGFPLDRIDAYIAENYRTEPKRTGRGFRGRYVSRKDTGRHFIIRAKNDEFRVVYPDFDDPSEVVVELNVRKR